MVERGPLDVTDAPFMSLALQTVSNRLISDGAALEGLRALHGWPALESNWATHRHRHRNVLTDGDASAERGGVWAWGMVQETLIDAVLEGQDAVIRTEVKSKPEQIKGMTDAGASEHKRRAELAREIVEHPGFAVACERWAGIQRGLRSALEVCDASAQPAIQTAIRALQQPVIQLRNLLRLGLVADGYFDQQKEGTGGDSEA